MYPTVYTQYMKSKVQERAKVLALRRKGYTYREILAEVPVAKSSVSLWLKDSPLTTAEKQALKKRRTAGIRRGRIRAAASLHRARVERDHELLRTAREKFKEHRTEPFFQVGIALYWAEGAKRSKAFGFVNTDADMVRTMLAWIEQFLLDQDDSIRMRVYTHHAFKSEKHELLWSQETGIPLSRFGKTVYKSHGLQVKKRPNYRGCVRIELGRIKYLRIMAYWQQMLIEECGKER